MRSREMYGRYRQLIEELANRRVASVAWFEELQTIVRRLDLESGDLAQSSGKLLYDELCDQFEQEAYQTDNEHRRKVLMGAIKLLEFHHI